MMIGVLCCAVFARAAPSVEHTSSSRQRQSLWDLGVERERHVRECCGVCYGADEESVESPRRIQACLKREGR